jgi:small subunit ribosomal protein S6
MSKTKSEKTPHYEMIYIISNKYSEEELNKIIKKIDKLITDNSGKITYNENWGKKKLAYQIKGFKYGYYNLVEFDLKGEKLLKLNNSLRMETDIIRHQIVSCKLKTKQEIEKEKKKMEKIWLTKLKGIEEQEQKTKKLEKKEEKKSSNIKNKKTKKESEQKKDNQIEKEKKEAKNKDIKLEDLDKKLDKILDTDNLL